MPPFAPSDWPRNEFRAEAEVLWQWHHAAQAGEYSSVYHSEAHAICEKFNLPAHLIDAQFIEEGVPTIHTITDLFDYMDRSTGSHALLLTKLAGYTANWVEDPVRKFGRALFLTRSLMSLKEDVLAGRQFIPLDLLQKNNVDSTDLVQGRLSSGLRSVLWKQVVYARDAYASCRTLNSDLSGWCRRRFRIYWTGGLHTLARIESRKFDVWSKPVELTLLDKTRVYLRVYTGKTIR